MHMHDMATLLLRAGCVRCNQGQPSVRTRLVLQLVLTGCELLAGANVAKQQEQHQAVGTPAHLAHTARLLTPASALWDSVDFDYVFLMSQGALAPIAAGSTLRAVSVTAAVGLLLR